VLVFEEKDGSYIPKVADFGFSTRFRAEGDLIYLPESIAWNAPERTHRAFTPSSALKMDIYSFGLLCLWILFGSSPDLQPPPDVALLPGQYVSFDHPLDGSNRLQYIKRDNKNSLLNWAVWLTTQTIQDSAVRESMVKLFRLSLPHDPKDRCDDFGCLVDLLESNPYVQGRAMQLVMVDADQ
jgi:serine/threonine protein kinase